VSDLERRLEDLFTHDSRSRRVTAVEVPSRRAGPLRGLAFVGATALAVVALIVALNTLRPGPTPLASPTASASPTTTSAEVVRCGETTQFVAPTADHPGSFVITSEGRAELVMVPAGSGLAAAGGYNCARIRPGTPSGELVAMIPIGGPGYVPPPSPSAAPTAQSQLRPDAQHGFLSQRPDAIRTEVDAVARAQFPQGYAAAVSIDGKRVAMLVTTQTGSRLVTFRTDQPQQMTTVLDFAGTGEGVGQIAWAADDSSSVLISVHKFRPPTESTEYTTLRAVDLATRSVTEIARFTDGRFLVPLYWDPVTGSAAAYETGPGGFGVDYVLLRGGQISRTDFPFETIANTIKADARTGRILAIVGRDRTAVSTWRYDHFDQRTDLRPAAGEQVHVALWRPNREEIVVSVGPPAVTSEPAMRMEVWSMANARRQLSGAGTSRLLLVRVDGTAALNFDFTLIDLETGRALGVLPRFLAACSIPPGSVPCGFELPYLPVLF
jgi:hypothetical protein